MKQRPPEPERRIIIACGRKNGRGRRTRHDLSNGSSSPRILRSPPPRPTTTDYELHDELLECKSQRPPRRERKRPSRCRNIVITAKFAGDL